MSASADKVQHILQGCLQESAALVRKGVFDQTQLQAMMLRREKYENGMLKREFKLTDYLGAIEYQYQLERERRSRMVEKGKLQESMNPLFKKESSSDFAIVKRIIRLWDRTMHKYKFKLHLWKQYLSLTLAIASKKHFYKTLTNALRFLPFEVDLWKIGAAYEMEQGKNLWKGRKILIKGMKMVPAGTRNIELAEFMITYEVYFLRTLSQRRDILIKGEEGIKMIGVEEEEENEDEEHSGTDIKEDTLNLQEYDKIIWLVLEQVFRKNTKSESNQLNFDKIKNRLKKLLVKLRNKEERKDVAVILQKVIQRLDAHNEGFPALQVLEQQFQPQIKIKQQEQNKPTDFSADPIAYWQEQILQRGSSINWTKAQQALKAFCLKPQSASQILNFLLSINEAETLEFILKKKSGSKLPVNTLLKLIEIDLSTSDEKLDKLISTQIDRWLTVGQLRDIKDLFQQVVRFNTKENRFTSTTKLLRSLSIVYRNEPQFLQLCNKVGNSF